MIARVSILLKSRTSLTCFRACLLPGLAKDLSAPLYYITHFNNIETRAVIKFFPLQGKASKEIHAILTETLACSFPGRAKDLSAPLYYITHFNNIETRAVIKFFPLQGKASKEIHAILTETLAFFLPGRAKDLSAPCIISYISASSRRELSSSFFPLQGKAPKVIHAILTETLACFLPDRAKDLSAPLYYITHFNNIDTRAVIKFYSTQCKAPKEIHTILTETLACFLPARAKDLSAPLYVSGE